ncbi:MAG: NnrS family protein [Pseudomonadota bacterium]|nr:NnrS family protein [Pseudomonadota bacterium]
MSAKPLEAWRLFFPTAAALAVVGLVAWGVQLAGIPLGLLPSDHAGFMVWGVFGSGIFGFLLTAYPRQNDAAMPTATLLWGLLAAQLLSVAALLLGRSVLPPELRAVLVALPWVATLGWVLPVARASLKRRWDDTTAAIPLALAAAVVGVVLHALEPIPLLAGTGVRGISFGVGPFVVLVALAVLDRVLPFFSARAVANAGATPGATGGDAYTGRRTPWFLGPLAALLWAKALFPAHAAWFAAGLLVVLLRQWWGWRPWPAARTPMIAVIHVGLGWMALAWFADLLGAPATVGTHALLVGGIGTLLFGISMRVVRGHSNLPVVLGRAGAVVMVLAQLAAALRVWVGWAGGGTALYVASAALLVAAFGVWLVRFGPVVARRG